MRAISLKPALCGLATLTLLAAAHATPAATPPAPAPAPPPAATAAPAAPTAPRPAAANPDGPLIPGVCLLSQETLITHSKIGQAATGRLREITQSIQANLTGEKTRLEARSRALEAKRATLTPLQLQAQGQAINQRAQTLQAEAGERSQQLDATKTKAFDLVLQQARPLITKAYAAHGCGLLFARETVLTGNLGNDLTGEVIAGLDATAKPVVFDLEPAKAK